MQTKRWIQYWFFLVIIISSAVSMVNFAVDPYGIFGTKLPYHLNTNKTNIAIDRMSKFYYAKRTNPNVLLMGSSRMAVFHPDALKPYVRGKIYNLSMGSCSIQEQYEYLKYMIENHKIHTIVLSIDLYTFNPKRLDKNSENYKRFIPERLTKSFYYKDYIDALFTFDTLKKSRQTIINNLNKTIPQYDLYSGTDTWGPQLKAEKEQGTLAITQSILNTLKQYATDEEYYNSKTFQDPDSIKNGIAYYKKIITLCKQNNINLKIYISPIYYKHYDLIRTKNLHKTFNALKIALVEESEVYDFSFPSSVTKNHNNFLDSSHIKREFGQVIFSQIFTGHQAYKDFGVLLTKKNIKLILENYNKRNTKIDLQKLFKSEATHEFKFDSIEQVKKQRQQ